MNLIDIKILNIVIERLLNKELAQYGITYTQATVIGYLKQNAGRDVYQKDIEYNLGLTHSTVSILLGRMVEKHLITIHTSDEDRRYKKVELTSESLAISNEINVKITKITEKLFNEISLEEQELFRTVLEKMIKNIS